MVFSGLTFLYVFFPLTLLLHTVIRNTAAKNAILLVMSLLFYAWGEPVWVFLMIATSLINWLFGLLIGRLQRSRGAAAVVLLAVIVDLALLGVFKYTGFFVTNLNALLHLALPVPQISLPIGISFYTFQTLSYIIDVYRGDTAAQKNPINFMLYVALFPQLIAGPIVRYTDIEQQLSARYTSPSLFALGITKFLAGLGKKVLLANYAGKLAGELLSQNPGEMAVLGGWLGILCYAFQIYFDFSGYSDMAIGLGKLFGFTYPENFEYPYISRSITEFWRRWHISLGSFFRDYVYIPLGGNRRHQLLNMLVVWFLTGLWHGASWNFILWGLYFFVLLAFEKYVLKKVKIPAVLGHIAALFFILLGWVFFYFTDLTLCVAMLKLLFGLAARPLTDPLTSLTLQTNLVFLLLCAVACLPLSPLVKKRLRKHAGLHAALTLAYTLLMLFLCTAAMVGSTFNPFLYFKF